jgi:hypothetical protein
MQGHRDFGAVPDNLAENRSRVFLHPIASKPSMSCARDTSANPAESFFQQQQRTGARKAANLELRLNQASAEWRWVYGKSLRKYKVLEAPALFARGTDFCVRCGNGTSGQER